jgi:signal transduction histidine kinase/CheY-like chemotaxis protein
MTSNRFIYFILSAFVLGNLLLIFVQYNSAKNIDNLITGNKRLQHELMVDNQLRELERDLLSTEIKIRGTVATNDSANLSGIDQYIADAKDYLDSLKQDSKHDSTLSDINRLYEVANEKLAFKNRILDSFSHSGRLSQESFNAIMQQRRLTNVINIVSRRIYDSRRRLIDSLSISVSTSGRKARSWGTTMILAVLASEAVLFWFVISRIRRQNLLIEQLDSSEKKVREVSMIKENFMANMSHEIRTPMNAILGFTNLLKAKNRDPALAEFIESIQKSGENLLTIVDDILDLSKIEAGMIRIESVPFSIRGVFHSIQTIFAEKIKEKGLAFSSVIDESIPDKLLGDATRLTQILANMIGNAIKFTFTGSIHIEVRNQGLADNVIRVSFVVSDTGIGIEKEKLAAIFERFQQAEDSITRKFGGTGLGLSIAKDLILLQKGDIDVESVPGKGTSFRFMIPFLVAAEVSERAILADQKPLGSSDLHHIHILVVEDNEINQQLLKHLLSEWKLSFTMVVNGKEAIKILESESFSLILMDIQMPGMDGYTAAQEIRQRLRLDIPIIAMTARAFPGEREKCLSYGMNGYIAKPFKEEEMYRLILQWAGGNLDSHSTSGDFPNEPLDEYQFVDLKYLHEISGGDMEFEKKMTGEFLKAIPSDLDALESAINRMDLSALRQTAHNMKTNVSIMGLSQSLEPYLDELEHADFGESHARQAILSIKTICLSALPEARHFYSTI